LISKIHCRGATAPPLLILLCAALPLFGQSDPFIQNPPPETPPEAQRAAPGSVTDATPLPAAPVTATIIVSSDSPADPNATFDVTADRQDAGALLNRIAAQARGSIIFVGDLGGSISTVNLRNVTYGQAVDLIARSAGLSAMQTANGWIVGPPYAVASSLAPPPAIPGQPTQAVYRCEHISAVTLVTTLQASFDPSALRVVLGPTYLSPSLSPGRSTVAVTGEQGSAIATLGEADTTLRTGEVVLIGDADTVRRALDLAAQLDHHRAQVRINVSISDVSVDALRQLGLQWSFSPYTLRETPDTTQQTPTGSVPAVSGIRFGKFAHSPVSVTAVISALETEGRAKLLAQPTLALLDGERSFILIGQRRLFPRLVTIAYGSPTYDVHEVRVGIYVQVAAKIGRDNDVVLTIYPQVSLITDHLTINGGVYPVIETREQQTTIRARSGETIVIGGLIRDDDLKIIDRVPVLGRIPIFGELFKYRETVKTRNELIVTLTPEIELTE
jgi:type II secretory pathway component GspD/PulD (secretin)